MSASMELKIDGLSHTVKFHDSGDDVEILELVWDKAVVGGEDIHPNLHFKLRHAVAEVLAGEVMRANVDICTQPW